MERSPPVLQDYRLTTAEILYHQADYPDLTQSFLWQSLDRLPDFPKLTHFIERWRDAQEGEIQAVRIGYVGLVGPEEWSCLDLEVKLH
jgi:uncharacterized protein Usg